MSQEQTQETTLGQSEHDQKMIEVAEGRLNPDGTEAFQEQPQEQPQEVSERPEGLPDKFESVDDLINAYKNLESKMGQESQKPQPQEQEEQSVVDQDKFTNELIENGSLSDESYAELEKFGFNRESIDGYLDYLYNQSAVDGQGILDAVGGQENYDQVVEWAVENADQDIVEAYNASLERGDITTAKALISTIASGYTSANGEFGNRVQATPTTPTSDVFGSQAEITQAMSDPRYSGSSSQRDPAYIKQVEQKIMRSKF